MEKEAVQESKVEMNEHMEAGSFAETIVKMNGLLESAEKSAKEYLEGIIKYAEAKQKEADDIKAKANLYAHQKQEEADASAKVIIEDARKRADSIIAYTKDKCNTFALETKNRCEQQLLATKKQCDALILKAQTKSQETIDIANRTANKITDKK